MVKAACAMYSLCHKALEVRNAERLAAILAEVLDITVIVRFCHEDTLTVAIIVSSIDFEELVQNDAPRSDRAADVDALRKCVADVGTFLTEVAEYFGCSYVKSAYITVYVAEDAADTEWRSALPVPIIRHKPIDMPAAALVALGDNGFV